ncbi:MAG: tetratricopeptide repeat protein [Spirochaetes bacterium]|nr:tetratricopeptide repeat protein [Spirochaetota bacterium]
MSKQRIAILIATITLVVTVSGAFAQQSADPVKVLEQGVALFAGERYQDALSVFSRLLADPKAQAIRGDVMYWTALCYVALNDAVNAAKTMDAFLASYPNHPYVADILYQQGRLLFNKSEFEPALRVFVSFLEKAPEHEMAPSSIFWTAECLFNLGRLEEAEKLYRNLVEKHPKNVKVEAAGYRISLIRFKYREDELLKLLKWSHEETLRIVEEYQRREKTYEQAVAMYQRRLGEAARSTAKVSPEQETAQLNIRIDDLTIALAERDAKIAELTAALKAAERKTADASSVGTAPQTGAQKDREAMLDIKAHALDLLAYYLEWLATNEAKGGM